MATKRAHVHEDEQASSSRIVLTSNPKEDFKIDVRFSGQVDHHHCTESYLSCFNCLRVLISTI